MHKANYASRICHSCRPNCEAKYELFPRLLFGLAFCLFLINVSNLEMDFLDVVPSVYFLRKLIVKSRRDNSAVQMLTSWFDSVHLLIM